MGTASAPSDEGTGVNAAGRVTASSGDPDTSAPPPLYKDLYKPDGSDRTTAVAPLEPTDVQQTDRRKAPGSDLPIYRLEQMLPISPDSIPDEVSEHTFYIYYHLMKVIDLLVSPSAK